MRNHSFLVLGLLLVVGVFGVGTDGVKSVSVMEGDSVTLLTNLNEIQTDEVLQWKFPDDTIIAEIDRETNKISVPGNINYKGRLKLDKMTGSLTITNIKNTDSGVYKLQFDGKDFAVNKEFSVSVRGVFGVGTDGVKSVSVMEGDSVTILTNLNEIQTNEVLKWKIQDDTIIAEIDRETNKISVPGNINYKGRLKLDKMTGSLTITNIKNTDSGVYKLQFDGKDFAVNKEFSVTVHGVFSDDGVKKRSERKGESVILQTRITSIPEDDVIEWTFGPQDTDLVRTDRQNKKLIYNKDVTFKDRLQLDTKSGDLTVKNINTEVSGLYEVKIIKRTHTLQKIFDVTVDDSQERSGSTIAVSVICGVVIGALLTCAVAVCYWKKYRQSRL